MKPVQQRSLLSRKDELLATSHVSLLAGLDLPSKLGWHSLRKSFATNFMEQHPDQVWLLMDLLGHISPSVVHRYVKHSRAYLDQAIDRVIEELIPIPSPQEADFNGYRMEPEEVARG